jgi:hypothetical protein
MHIVAMVVGALVVIAGILGFLRSLWRPLGRHGNEGTVDGLAGMPTQPTDQGGGLDGGSH